MTKWTTSSCRILAVLAILFSSNLLLGQGIEKGQVFDFIKTSLKNKIKSDLDIIKELEALPVQADQGQLERLEQLIEFREGDKNLSNSEESESEIHAAINPTDTNNIIVASMRFTEGPLGGALSFPIYYTNDFGQSWDISPFDGVSDQLNSFVLGGGDPIIVFDNDGVAYLSWLTLTVDLSFSFSITLHWAISNDSGATWERQETLIDNGTLEDLEDPNARFVDKEWMVADLSDSPNKNNVYVAYAEINLSDTTYNILVKSKAADASEFSDAVDITPEEIVFAQFSSIDVDDAGTVHVMFTGAKEDDTALSLYHTKSTDGGQSFSAPVTISNLHLPCFPLVESSPCDIVGIDSSRMYPCPHLRVDKSGGLHNGNLYAVWTSDGFDTQLSAGVDIYFSKSEDSGDSWSSPIILNNDSDAATHNFFPSIAVNDQGTLVTTWYDRREDSGNVLTKYYMTFSRDGGDTFEDDFPVSAESSDFSVIGQANGNFGVGEYTQVVATDYFAIPFWADGRTNDGNVEVYSAVIPLDENITTSIEELGTLSTAFSIKGPWPNPAEGEANIEVSLKEASALEVQLVDVDGKVLRSIQQSDLVAGSYPIRFDLGELPAGTYFIVAKTDFGFRSKKLSIIK